MLCPLRKKIDNILNTAEFGNCLENKCEWWVPEEKDKIYGFIHPGHCVFHHLGLYLGLSVRKFRISF